MNVLQACKRGLQSLVSSAPKAHKASCCVCALCARKMREIRLHMIGALCQGSVQPAGTLHVLHRTARGGTVPRAIASPRPALRRVGLSIGGGAGAGGKGGRGGRGGEPMLGSVDGVCPKSCGFAYGPQVPRRQAGGWR